MTIGRVTAGWTSFHDVYVEDTAHHQCVCGLMQIIITKVQQVDALDESCVMPSSTTTRAHYKKNSGVRMGITTSVTHNE